MRIELPTPPPGGSPDPNAGATVAQPVEVQASAPVAKRKRESARERVLLAVTAWRVAGPTLALCVALMGWALLYRAPQGRKFMVVSARALAPAPASSATNNLPPLEILKAEERSRAFTLIRERRDISPLLTQLEAQARQLGWHCERSLKPAVPAAFGFTNLTLHPVTLHLSAEEGTTAPPYHRLIAWLRDVSSSSRRAEIVSLDLRADGSGLSSADVKLHFFSANSHAEVSPK